MTDIQNAPLNSMFSFDSFFTVCILSLYIRSYSTFISNNFGSLEF